MGVITNKTIFATYHNSTETRYILGMKVTKVTNDYDWWICDFEMPFNKNLFDKIKKFNAEEEDNPLIIGRSGDHIKISVNVVLDYGEIESDPSIELANVCDNIRDNILERDFSNLELLKAYAEKDKKKFEKLESTSGIKDIIDVI